MTNYFHKSITIKITLVLVLALTLISSPFYLERLTFANSEARGVLGILCFFLLFLGSKRFIKTDFIIYVIVLCFFTLEFLWKTKINNVMSYFATILIFLLVFRAIQLSKLYRVIFFRMWIQIAYFVSISFLILFVLSQLPIPETDILDFRERFKMLDFWSNPNYKFHIFGITMDKKYGSVNLTRVFGFFNEPQYAGFYFTVNLLLAHYGKNFRNKKFWVVMNFLAGVVTFSTTFFMALIPMFILHYTDLRFRFLFYVTAFAIFPIVLIGYEFLRNFSMLDLTSFADREVRIFNAIDVLKKASYSDLILGHGVGYQDIYKQGFSAGIFLILVEKGISGLFFVLTLLVYVLRKNFEVVLIFLLYLLAMPLYVNNLFWLSTLILWTGSQLRKEVEA